MTTSQPNHFDVLVLGCGEAGKYLAWTLSSKAGKRCAVIERRWVGGSCPNVACLPSKNIIHSANLVHQASQSTTYGLPFRLGDSGGSRVVEMEVIRGRKRDMVKGLVNMHLGSKTIEVNGGNGEKRTLSAEKIVIRTGSRARIDDTPGLKEATPLTHIEIMELGDIPGHLIVLGGGYIGLEFAQAMKRLGAEVTVIERNHRFLKNEDEDVGKTLLQILLDEGVKVYTSTTITEVSGQSGHSVIVKGAASGETLIVTGTHILCATGRVPNTENIGVEMADIKLTNKGFVKTDEKLETSREGIFAVGDCAGSPHFTHVAFDDFRIVRDVLTGKIMNPNRVTSRQVPFTLFTSPELAHVDLREHEARSMGIKFRRVEVPMAAFLKTRTLGETTGFAKALIAEDDRILGFTALGVGAGELLPVIQLVMKKGLSYIEITELVITHPTLNEGLISLFSTVPASG